MTCDREERFRYRLWWGWFNTFVGLTPERSRPMRRSMQLRIITLRTWKVIHWGEFFWWMVVSFEWWWGQIRENEDEMVRIEMPKVVRRSCREVEVRHNWSQDPSNFEPCSFHYCFFFVISGNRQNLLSIFGVLLKICWKLYLALLSFRGERAMAQAVSIIRFSSEEVTKMEKIFLPKWWGNKVV